MGSIEVLGLGSDHKAEALRFWLGLVFGLDI